MLSNYSISSVRLPNSKGFYNVNEFDKEIICITETLFDGMEEFFINKTLSYAYIGMSNGLFRLVPYYKNAYDTKGNCEEFDPRKRPW